MFQNKENFGPPPYQNPPSSLRAITSRQSEPILPQPPLHHPRSASTTSSAASHHVRRDVFPDRLSTSSSYARLQPHGGQGQPHSLDYYQLPSHNDSNFSNDGFLPSLQEADRYFGVDEQSFSGSRLSLGMRYHPGANDPMYETLSQYRSGGQRRWSNTSQGQQRFVMRREPPPLPPKPRLPPAPPHALRSTQSDVGILPSSRNTNGNNVGAQDSRHRDSGYSVSFVWFPFRFFISDFSRSSAKILQCVLLFFIFSKTYLTRKAVILIFGFDDLANTKVQQQIFKLFCFRLKAWNSKQ